jgi:hypothetical protein
MEFYIHQIYLFNLKNGRLNSEKEGGRCYQEIKTDFIRHSRLSGPGPRHPWHHPSRRSDHPAASAGLILLYEGIQKVRSLVQADRDLQKALSKLCEK